ncbi:trafficking protein particle complex subunit 12-like [Anopheles albimanus]|uniref:trafficking protein particle complex subunit 12-like n=1 Tax=Anopheles albimanus TaxID=7167 RepID=UPI00163EFB65|nr:trafficking protein particle complex subunit 12-like [Anopheles albimanus]
MANNQKSEPNISKYFANDPPSCFDTLTADEDRSGGGAGGAVPDSFLSYDYLGTNVESRPYASVPDSLRDLWEPPRAHAAGAPLTVLTMPGVSVATDLTDPIQEAVGLLVDANEAQQRRLLLPDNVTQDERGLRELIENGCFRSAVNLTARLLTIKQQGFGHAGHAVKHSPHSLQLWFTRLALLVKLGQYEIARVEAEPFGTLSNPDVFYEFYHPDMHADRKGSMAPFAFRLLLADLPIYLGAPRVALDRLTELLAIVSQIKAYFDRAAVPHAKDAGELWTARENRVLHSIVNCALVVKDYGLVEQLLGRLTEASASNMQQQRTLLSAWGRIRLQCGDIMGAERKFAEARRLKEDKSSEVIDLIDRGLFAVAQNDFQGALALFQKASLLAPANTMLYNNMGVCLLYSGKLKEAISMYEGAIQRNPKPCLNESLLVNLSTLYELESNNAKEKKINLLKLVNRHRADLTVGLDVCLKLQAIV